MWRGQIQVQLSNISLWQNPVMAVILTWANHSGFVYLFVYCLLVFGEDVVGEALVLRVVWSGAAETVRRWASFGHL